MGRKAIGIQGISTGSNYEDGACVNVVNMRHEQGVLKPVESFPVDFTLKHVYDLLYWHKNNDYSHLIGVRNNGIYWIQQPGEEAEDEGTALLSVTGTVTLSNMGNILNVLDGDVLKYIFWQEDKYYVIDMNFDNTAIENVRPVLKNTFSPRGYELTSGHSWTSYDLITHTVELSPNYFYITITDNKLYISFQYAIYYNLTVGLRIYENDNPTIYHDYEYEIVPSSENSWGTSLMHVEDLSYTATTNTDFLIVKSFSQPNSGIEVNDQGVPTVGGGYWTGNLTHYYLYEDGNYPPSPAIYITAYDGWEWVEHNDPTKQVYTITLNEYINEVVNGILYLTVDGVEQSHAFEMEIKDLVNTVQIILTQNADTARSVRFDNDENSFHIEIPEAISKDYKASYTITDSIFTRSYTHEFTVGSGSTVSETYTVKCSDVFSYTTSISQVEEIVGPVKIDLRVTIPTVTQEDIDNGDYVQSMLGKYKALITVSDEAIGYSNENDANNKSNQETRAEVALGLRQKSKSILNSKGYLYGFCHAIYAIELFDGNYILSSSPLLMGMAADKFNRYNYVHDTLKYNYKSNKAIFMPTYRSWDNGVLINLPSNIDGYYFGVRYANSSYTKNGGGLSDPNYADATFSPDVSLWEKYVDGNVFSKYIYHVSNLNVLQFKIDSVIDDKYKSIVKSVSIFLSPEVDLYENDKAYITGSTLYSSSGSIKQIFENYNPKVKTDSAIIKELKESQNLYKVHEISFEELQTITPGTWIDIDLKDKLGDNLVVQQALSIDAYGNIKANGQMTYNSMLHAWDIKNVALMGWPFGYFEQKEAGVGQFTVQAYVTVSDVVEAKWVSVKIKTDIGMTEVVRGFDHIASGVVTPTSGYGDFVSMLSYPDSMATEMTLYHKAGTTVYGKTYKLTASSTGNFAYYISPDLKPISWAGMDTSERTMPQEMNRELSYHNKLKVSNTNNPFLFPDGQTYQIGDGTILNVASQSIRTSDGQFGQYPLVCFCTDGVFTLQVGDGTVAYSKVGTPQNYERPISKVICVTPYGIAFISNRGLCMVVGQDIQYLSEPMFEKFRSLTLELPEQIAAHYALDLGTFNDYLKACTAMVYNPKEQEIIMINPDKAYNYVYNMITKQFYRNTEAITNEINNSLPDMQVWNGTTVKKVTVVEPGTRAITFVTRPMKMQTPDMKRFERVVLRAYLSAIDGTPATACIWGSVDDRNFKLLRGMVLMNDTDRKDIDFGLFGKTTYRSYVIGLSMTVGTDSEIEAIEMQVEQEFVDTRMR